MLKEIATPAKWQGGSFKTTELQFICPSSTKKNDQWLQQEQVPVISSFH